MEGVSGKGRQRCVCMYVCEKSVVYVYMHVSEGVSVLHTITCIHSKCMLQLLNYMPTELEFTEASLCRMYIC